MNETITFEKKIKYEKIRITTTITIDLKRKIEQLQKDNPQDKSITFAECIRIGAGVILNESGDEDYNSSINILRKNDALVNKLNEFKGELDKLKEVKK